MVKTLWIIFSVFLTINSVYAQFGYRVADNTGLTVSYRGFQVGEFFLIDAKTERELQSTVIPINNYSFAIVLTGIRGFKRLENKNVLPGMDLLVTEKQTGKVLLDQKDIIQKEVSREDAARMSAEFTASRPMVLGREYVFSVYIYDKNSTNSKKRIVAEVTLTAE